MPKKPIWTEGLLVSQHHFQQQDRYHEALLQERARALVQYDWGVTELELDERAIASGQIRIKRLAAIWPDGCRVACGDSAEDSAPEPRSFEAMFRPELASLEVFAAIAYESETAANLAGDAQSGPGRFARVAHDVPDLNTGLSPQQLEWARPNLKIFFGGERHEGFALVQIAELVRQANGQPIIRDTYVPPVLHFGASPFLVTGLRRVLTAIVARQRQLASERNQRQAGMIDFHAHDARKFWLLHTLNGAIPVLSHWAEARRAHPEQVYLALVTLIGQLSTFSVDTDLVNLPKFNYADLGSVFEVLFAKTLSLLSGGIERLYVEIPLEHRADGMFIGKIPDPALAKQEFFVAIDAPISEALVRERIPNVLKIAAWNDIIGVVKHAHPGVRVDVEYNPPTVLPAKTGQCFFRMQRKGNYWGEVEKTSTLALHLPHVPDWKGAAISVFVVDPQRTS